MDLAIETPRAISLEDELVALYPALVRRLALVLHDRTEAEDVAQSAFEKALGAQRRFVGGDVRAWFYTIALRLAFNELRRRRRRDSSPDAADPIWVGETDIDLWAALSAIDAQPRAALLLSVLDGYTHSEIGVILGVPPGTVSSWLSRTKDRLRNVLKED